MLKVFILNWNGSDKLSKLYPSLIKSLKNIDYSILIKDNGSVDTSIDLIKSWNNSNVKLFEIGHNRDNYSEGMNYLFDKSEANDNDYILMLNNDIIFNDTKSIHNMLKLIKNDQSVGLVGAKLNYTNSNKIQHCGVLFHPINGLPFHYRAGMEEENIDCEDRIFPIITGAVCITKASTYKKLRMPEQMKWCFDDCYFSMQITHDLGLKVVCCGSTNISHEESASLKKNPVNKLYISQNIINFNNKWRDKVDISLIEKYSNPKYNIYKGKK